MKKKIFAALAAAVTGLCCLAAPVSAESQYQMEEITDPETIVKMVRTYWASLGLDKNIVWGCDAEYFPDNPAYSPTHAYICYSYAYSLLYADITTKFMKDHNIDMSKIAGAVSVSRGLPDDFPTDEADYPAYMEKMKAYTLGDLTENGTVQLDDALKALKAYTVTAGQAESGLSETQSYAADVDGSGDLTLSDAQNILRYYTVNTLGQQNVSWVDIVMFGA